MSDLSELLPLLDCLSIPGVDGHLQLKVHIYIVYTVPFSPHCLSLFLSVSPVVSFSVFLFHHLMTRDIFWQKTRARECSFSLNFVYFWFCLTVTFLIYFIVLYFSPLHDKNKLMCVLMAILYRLFICLNWLTESSIYSNNTELFFFRTLEFILAVAIWSFIHANGVFHVLFCLLPFSFLYFIAREWHLIVKD